MRKLVLSAVAAAAVALTASVAGAQELKLKMASTYPSKLTQLGSLGKALEENVAAISGGQIELKFYELGVLVPVFNVVLLAPAAAVAATTVYLQFERRPPRRPSA